MRRSRASVVCGSLSRDGFALRLPLAAYGPARDHRMTGNQSHARALGRNRPISPFFPCPPSPAVPEGVSPGSIPPRACASSSFVMMHVVLGIGERMGAEGFLHPVVAFAAPFRMPDFFLISGLFLARVIDRDMAQLCRQACRAFSVYFYVL